MKFKMFDIDIIIHWSWWIFAAFISIRDIITLNLVGIAFDVWLVACLAAMVLVHELAHALAGRKFGCKTKSIYLHLLGGAAFIENLERLSEKESLLVSAAGPASNFVLGILMLFFIPFFEPTNFWFLVPFLVTWMMGIFNLIPAFPMDGGRITRSALQLAGVRRTKAIAITQYMAVTFAALFVIGGVCIGAPLLALIGVLVGIVVWWERRGNPV